MTPEETRNVERLHEAWAKWHETKGSHPEMWKAYMTPDVTIFSLADRFDQVRFAKPRKGHDELMAFLHELLEDFSMDFWRIDETVAQGDRVVGIGATKWTNRSTGKSSETPVVVMTRWRDGSIYDYAEYYDTADILASTMPDSPS